MEYIKIINDNALTVLMLLSVVVLSVFIAIKLLKLLIQVLKMIFEI